jgi:hypothetical protein
MKEFEQIFGRVSIGRRAVRFIGGSGKQNIYQAGDRS